METRAGNSLRRRFLFAFLYLSEGAPIGFIWWALPARLRLAGVATEDIASLVALLVFPWTLKFLWAPIVDSLQSSRWTLRSWILVTQTAMGLTLIPLLFLDLHRDLAVVMGLLFLHAIAAATQDVAVDALAIGTISEHERGSINGWMQAGMLVGRSALGGGALLLASWVGQAMVIVVLIGVIWFSMAFLVFAGVDRVPPDLGKALAARQRWTRVFQKLKQVGSARATWVALLFALIGGAGFEAVGSLVTPFLIDMGATPERTGSFMAGPVVLAMMVGSFAGGYLSDRLGRRAVVAVCLFLISLLIATLSLRLGQGASEGEILVLLGGLYLGIGLFTASSYAMFMDVSDPQVGATQFSTYMGATNGCEMWSAFLVGRLIGQFGYGPAFLVMAIVPLAALPLLPWLRLTPAGNPRNGAQRD